ncbi:MAG: hypothetical protein JNL33_10135 [Betaproteobacteria bacterium]|nr:hypothetical protein [Betaproteobacteria bacterium]MBL8534196.1 hypothetical protein [Betaproteobacteria bacterium]
MPHLALFPTPVSMYEIPDTAELNRELTERLTAESLSTPSDHRSNVGSWHSPTNLHTRTEPCFQRILREILLRVKETSEALAKEAGRTLPNLNYRAHAWAMVMRNGDYTLPHDHSEVHWATAYYPDAGDANESEFPDSGLIGFVDPRHGGRPIPGLDLVGKTFYGKPQNGRLFVFPGWLLHYVNAYRGTRPRIVISCNVVFSLA